jgi:hypothetical protein
MHAELNNQYLPSSRPVNLNHCGRDQQHQTQPPYAKTDLRAHYVTGHNMLSQRRTKLILRRTTLTMVILPCQATIDYCKVWGAFGTICLLVDISARAMGFPQWIFLAFTTSVFVSRSIFERAHIGESGADLACREHLLKAMVLSSKASQSD